MTAEWRPWNACRRKRRYAFRGHAEKAMGRLRRDTRDGEELGIYFCEHCRGYHVGHLLTVDD